MTNTQLQRVDTCVFVTQWILVGCALWLLLGFFSERQLPVLPQLDGGTATRTAPSSPNLRLSLAHLDDIWKRDLRQTLIEPPAEPPPKPKITPVQPRVKLPKLLATFVERGQAWGLFVDRSGTQRVRSASGTIDDLQIVDLGPGIARLTRNGEWYDLQVPRPRKQDGIKQGERRRRTGR